MIVSSVQLKYFAFLRIVKLAMKSQVFFLRIDMAQRLGSFASLF